MNVYDLSQLSEQQLIGLAIAQSLMDVPSTSNNEEEREPPLKRHKAIHFVEDLVTELNCPICLELLIHAHTLPCSHTFCKSCLKHWMTTESKKSCPTCRQPFSKQPIPLLLIDNMIEKIIPQLALSQKDKQERLFKKSQSSKLEWVKKKKSGVKKK